MKPMLWTLLCMMAVTGCSSLSHEQRAAYCHPAIPSDVTAKLQRGGKLDTDDVVALSKNGVRSSEIITYLAYSGTDFTLTPQDAETLEKSGVSGDVITYIREQPNHTGGLFSTFTE